MIAVIVGLVRCVIIRARCMSRCLGRGVHGLRSAMQKIGGALRMRRGGENRAVVAFHRLDPMIDIRGVIVAKLGRQFEVGAKKCGAKFGDKLFHRVTFVAKPLAPEFTVQAAFVPSPVAGLMGTDSVIALCVAEEIDARHMDVVSRGDVTSPVATVNDIRARRREKVSGMGDALHGVRPDFRLAVIMLGQSLDLLNIENGVTFHEGDRVFALLAGRLIRLGTDDLVGVHDKAALLALPDMRLQFQGLLEGHPDRSGVTFIDGWLKLLKEEDVVV
jgi:hypothetical protein